MRSLGSRLGITKDMAAQEDGEIFEATVFLDYFMDLPDSRQPGKVIYLLDEVLLLALLATLAGAEAFTDIARFGEKKLSLLRRFRPFRDGTLRANDGETLPPWEFTLEGAEGLP